jgi:steroid 5-alpha reductase family enzyme
VSGVDLPMWAVWAGSWAIVAAAMAILWDRQRRTGNAGIVDVAWSFGTALVGVLFCFFGEGDPARRLLLGALIGAWGSRLGLYLWRRVLREPEDGRYTAIREKVGSGQQRWLFLFFQLQAAWALIFASPLFFAARNSSEGLGFLDIAGAAIWLLAIGGETVADRQLARFKRDLSNRGRVCREGLWSWSRHPNYFFEWLHWFAYVAIGWHAPWGALTLVGPAVMLFFLLRVTGIPPTEAQALRSRGEAYRRYQAEVSAFVPLPPRRSAPSPSRG